MAKRPVSAFFRENWMLLAVFLVAALFALLMAIRVLMDFIYFNDPNNVHVDLVDMYGHSGHFL